MSIDIVTLDRYLGILNFSFHHFCFNLFLVVSKTILIGDIKYL